MPKFAFIPKRPMQDIQCLPRGIYCRYMDCTARESLGTNSLVASAPYKKMTLFLALKAETGILNFKHPGPFKLT
jgi:hypothetical protein